MGFVLCVCFGVFFFERLGGCLFLLLWFGVFFSPPTNFFLLLILKLAFNFGMIVELVLLPVRFAL